MNFKGKKAFCFLALKHHSRFLLPITRVLEQRGMEVQYLTAPAEMPFELTLQDEGLSYRHTQHYAEPPILEEIDRAYREVRSAWKEKFLHGEVLHHFTLPVQDKVLRMHVDNFYLFRRMFEVEKPDLVLALHELNSWGKMLGYLSHEFRVPLITLQEGLYYAPAAVYRFHTEYSSACLVWGEATREVLVRSGGSADKIFIVGNTHLQKVVAEESSPARIKKTRKEINAGRAQKIVTLLMGGLGYDKGFAFPPALLDWLSGHPELILVCKWHPVTHKLVIEEIARGLNSIPNIRMLQEFDTYRLLAASEVCAVFGNSTTGLEALAFGKPLIEVQLGGLGYSFAAQGVADAVSSLIELPAAVDRILEGADEPDRARRVEQYLEQNLHRRDGKSIDRCVEVIESVLAARAERSGSAPLSPCGARSDLLCSVIVPLRSADGSTQTLLGVAENTPAQMAYECLLPTTLAPHERGAFVDALSGDVLVLQSDRDSVGGLYNAAARRAAGKYLCFLTPGWVPQAGWLQGLMRQLDEHPEVGVAGGLALFPDGFLAHAGMAIDGNLTPIYLYRRLPANFPGAHRRRRMAAVCGCLLVRREAFIAAGGFDASYTGNRAEIDFCLAAAQHGWRVAYTPETLLICLETAGQEDAADRLRFFAKWAGFLWPDQDGFWAQDDTNPARLAALYEEVLRDTPRADPLTICGPGQG
jgi:hypothetical protein